MTTRNILYFIVLLIALLCIGGYIGYKQLLSPNVIASDGDSEIIHVNTGSTYEDLIDTLMSHDLLVNESSFVLVSKLMKYKTPKPGRYLINSGLNNIDLVRQLRSGKQFPVKVTFNNLRNLEALGGRLSYYLEYDSITMVNYLHSDRLLAQYGMNKENFLTKFIPNTYEFYWNTSPINTVRKLIKQTEKFYNTDRKEKLKQIGLSQKDAYILASIVQKETLVNAEKPRVAGVYINRLNRGQLLQADPTVVYAVGNFDIRRVLNKHIAVDSPYNTYKYQGLPPGPITMPDISSIEAVLNYEKHNYLYFCAYPDNSGKHQFAKNLIDHNRNANKYRKWLNQRRIYK